jgi:glycosyltransferase involved in cell wall biosynthesis
VSFQHLVNELRQQDKVKVTVLSTTVPGRNVVRVMGRLSMVLAMIRGVLTHDVVCLNASSEGYVTLSGILRPVCRLLGKPLVGRLFGAGITSVYDKASQRYRERIEKALSPDLMLLQTHDLVRTFSARLPRTRIEWFPTSRPLSDSIGVRPKPKDVMRLIFGGHIREDKGVLVALAALRALASPAVVHFYGKGTDARIAQLIAECPGAKYGGELPPDKFSETLGEYDALLMPTFYEGEGYPGIILESFGKGLPVIASDWKDIPELVQQDSNGLLVPPRDAAALTEAIDRLCSEPSLYERLSKGAVATARHFDSAKWNREKFVEFVRSLEPFR